MPHLKTEERLDSRETRETLTLSRYVSDSPTCRESRENPPAPDAGASRSARPRAQPSACVREEPPHPQGIHVCVCVFLAKRGAEQVSLTHALAVASARASGPSLKVFPHPKTPRVVSRIKRTARGRARARGFRAARRSTAAPAPRGSAARPARAAHRAATTRGPIRGSALCTGTRRPRTAPPPRHTRTTAAPSCETRRFLERLVFTDDANVDDAFRPKLYRERNP